LQENIGFFGHIGALWIYDDHLCAALKAALHLHSDDRVTLARVGTDE